MTKRVLWKFEQIVPIKCPPSIAQAEVHCVENDFNILKENHSCPNFPVVMAASVPNSLKSADIARFATRAAQVEKAKPAVAYWCMWAGQRLICRFDRLP